MSVHYLNVNLGAGRHGLGSLFCHFLQWFSNSAAYQNSLLVPYPRPIKSVSSEWGRREGKKIRVSVVVKKHTNKQTKVMATVLRI